MTEFITLSCPSCGNKLQITSDIDRFACAACGNEHIVNRSGGIVTLKPVIEVIKGIKVGVDKTASELAIARLEREIEIIEDEIDGFNDDESYIVSFVGTAGGIAVMVLFILIGIIALAANIIVGLIILALVFGFWIVGYLKGKQEDAEFEQETEPLFKKLEVKKKELAKHKEIVSILD